jgi:hypothetical protein
MLNRSRVERLCCVGRQSRQLMSGTEFSPDCSLRLTSQHSTDFCHASGSAVTGLMTRRRVPIWDLLTPKARSSIYLIHAAAIDADGPQRISCRRSRQLDSWRASADVVGFQQAAEGTRRCD